MQNPGLGRRSEAILATLRDRIRLGDYASGGQMPTEEALCQEFDVSRSTIRRSLSRLAEEGLVRKRRGAGTFVCGRAEQPAATRTLSVMYNFHGETLTQFQDYALRRGYLLCVFSQRRERWDLLAERAFLELVLRQHHQGLLAYCSPTEPRNEDRLMRLAEVGIRVVHIEHYRYELPDQPYLLPDYRKAGHMAAVRLLISGCDRLLFVGHNIRAPYSRRQQDGMAAALAEHGNGFDPTRDRFVIPPLFTEDRNAMEALASRCREGRTGLVCESAGIASMALAVVTRAGLADRVRVLGTELPGLCRNTFATQTLRFDRQAIVHRAMDYAMGESSHQPRELVAPEFAELLPTETPKEEWA